MLIKVCSIFLKEVYFEPEELQCSKLDYSNGVGFCLHKGSAEAVGTGSCYFSKIVDLKEEEDNGTD